MNSNTLLLFISCLPWLVLAQTPARVPSETWHDALKQRPEIIDLVDPEQAIVDVIPDAVLKTNKRFLTFSIENDYFGNGTDKDYTNGVRFTYMNTGARQPFFVDWIDRLSPTFTINKTTTSYFSIGQNLYTPNDITQAERIKNDRPYAAFAYISGGLATATDNHIDNAELTLGIVGPSARGEIVQTKVHEWIDYDLPKGWQHQIHDELGVILSLERQWPLFMAARLNNDLRLSLTPHVGGSLGNIYTYANTGVTLTLTPDDDSLQAQPPRVRPAIPGSGFFLSGDKNWSWMAYLGFDARLVAHNIFLDGNTFRDSHSVDKYPLVLDASLGIAVNYDDYRVAYSLNWRSAEFDSPLANDQVFGSISLSFSF